MQVFADSGPLPHEIPTDAIAVLAWDETDYPPKWYVAGIVVGATNRAEAREAVAKELRGELEVSLLASKIGGNQSEVKRVRRTETRTVGVVQEDVGG